MTNDQGYKVTYSIDGGNSYQNSSQFNNLPKGTYEIIIRKEKELNICETPKTVEINQLIYLNLLTSQHPTLIVKYTLKITIYIDTKSISDEINSSQTTRGKGIKKVNFDIFMLIHGIQHRFYFCIDIYIIQ